MAFEAAWTAARGGTGVERAAQIARQAEELSQRVANQHAIGLSIWATGVVATLPATGPRLSSFAIAPRKSCATAARV
jgi:hypothetical protein